MRVTLRNPKRIVEIDGCARVRDVLTRLSINPETVLVIRGADLLPREAELEPDDDIEIRPVISGGQEAPAEPAPAQAPRRPRRRKPGGAAQKCRSCRGPAVVDVPAANAAFCKDCFTRFVHHKVERAIHEYEMFTREDKLLVAVSGGKDSLALWDILLDMGYDATGFHLVLWTGDDYAAESREMCEAFARSRGARLIVRDLKADEGFTIAQVSRTTRRAPCSVCGLAKRHLLSAAADEGGFDVLVTGHNLDDEAATLFGNVMHWSTEYMARQKPLLPQTHPRFRRKAKPLYRLAERESAAYAILHGIDYIVEECPLVAGNTQHKYKEALNTLEQQSPGTKQQFVLGFHARAAEAFAGAADVELRECSSCGMPTPGEVCAYCKAVKTLRLAPAPER